MARTLVTEWARIPALMALAILIVLTPETAGAQQITMDPGQSRLETVDLERFAGVMRALQEGGVRDTVAMLDRDYLAHASTGLLAYIEAFDVTASGLASALVSRPAWYQDIDTLIGVIRDRENELREGFRRLQEVFPGAAFPPVWFVVGGHGPRGQASPVGALIGAEGLSHAPERITPLVLHELAHFQSGMMQGVETYRRIYDPSHRSLLALALREGSAEFIAWLTTGSHTNPAAEAYGLARESELWTSFQEDMTSPDTGDWMWVQPTEADRPPDLGYWIGYRIVRSYYDRAKDKRQAVLDILGLTDFEGFLEKSGYAERIEGGWKVGVCERGPDRPGWSPTISDFEHVPDIVLRVKQGHILRGKDLDPEAPHLPKTP
jgi:hypothetical protein